MRFHGLGPGTSLAPARGVRVWLFTIVVIASAGCGFSVPTEDELDPGDPSGPGDPTDPTDPPEPVARRCDTSDPTLRLCIDFEDTPSFAEDGSGRGHHATTTSVAVMNRAAEQAVLVGAASRVVVAEHADLDLVDALTVSMWMRADALDSAAQYLLDNNRQYAVSYQPDGQIRCGLGSTTVDSLISYFDQAWHHVACTYDGQRLKVFVDGSVQGCTAASTIATTGAEGLAIGANLDAGPTYSGQFIGGLDNVQVFARAWTPAELCTTAGSTLCNASCGLLDLDD